MCYCPACHQLRGCSPVSAAGSPPRPFTLPLHWALFPLRARGEGGEEREGRDAWHLAFHGTKIGHVRWDQEIFKGPAI